LADPNRLNEWDRMADAARDDMARRGITPPAGERMAKEQPSLHYLYREIANASAAFDRAELRKRLFAIAMRSADVLRGLSMPTLFGCLNVIRENCALVCIHAISWSGHDLAEVNASRAWGES
jgi:hypothetical protein